MSDSCLGTALAGAAVAVGFHKVNEIVMLSLKRAASITGGAGTGPLKTLDRNKLDVVNKTRRNIFDLRWQFTPEFVARGLSRWATAKSPQCVYSAA